MLFRCVIHDEERKNAHYPRIVVAPPVDRATTRATTTTAALYSRLLFHGATSTADFDPRRLLATTARYDVANNFYERSTHKLNKHFYIGTELKLYIFICHNL